jgi:hypothetical protein
MNNLVLYLVLALVVLFLLNQFMNSNMEGFMTRNQITNLRLRHLGQERAKRMTCNRLSGSLRTTCMDELNTLAKSNERMVANLIRESQRAGMYK